jgi:hypothetical protein
LRFHFAVESAIWRQPTIPPASSRIDAMRRNFAGDGQVKIYMKWKTRGTIFSDGRTEGAEILFSHFLIE